MTTQPGPLGQGSGPGRAGTATLVLGILFAAAVAYTYVLSLSDLVDPPNWARAAGLVWLPVGIVGVPLGYAIARGGEGRDRGLLGVLVGLIGLAALVTLLFALG